MLIKRSKSSQAGTFTIAPGRHVHGELTLASRRTALHLHDKDFFWTRDTRYLTGVLHDLTKVSLIDCVTIESTQSSRSDGGGYHSANIFPHFVVLGDQHIAPEEKTITEVHFVIDDASTLFYDFDAFGSVIDARPFIEQIVGADARNRKIVTGPDPQILYFTGKREIFAIETVIGRISASHNPSRTLIGGPEGVQLRNTIFTTIAFKEPVLFEVAISQSATLLAYSGMLVGRPQNLRELLLHIGSDRERPVILRVHCSHGPKRNRTNEAKRPHPADALINGGMEPEVFSRVMAGWLGRQQEWRDARARFFGVFAKQRSYDIDRLIGAANMFDILPASVVAPEAPLTDEQKIARLEARRIFRALPKSPERDSVLGSLGRLGKSNLKQKVRHRAQVIIDAAGERFPELSTGTDEAVNCRNYYVHGGERRLDYDANFVDTVAFFTDTLEFVFAASDLIESGWDIKAWSEIPTSMSHPFGQYRVNYAGHLQRLKALLAASPATEG